MAELFKGLEVPNIQSKLEEGTLKENLGALSVFLNDLLLKSQKVSFVGQYGDEVIYGIKTFDSIPLLPDADPTSDNQAVSKKYVDGATPAISGENFENLDDIPEEAGVIPAANLPAVVSFPAGIIAMWSGTIATIPTGWYLCDGNNGTPDLRDKFVIGAKQDDSGVAKTNVTGSLTQSGGEATHTLSIEEIPAHTHSAVAFTGNCGRLGTGSPNFTTGVTGSTGGGLAHNNLPPYYALAYIMKG